MSKGDRVLGLVALLSVSVSLQAQAPDFKTLYERGVANRDSPAGIAYRAINSSRLNRAIDLVIDKCGASEREGAVYDLVVSISAEGKVTRVWSNHPESRLPDCMQRVGIQLSAPPEAPFLVAFRVTVTHD